MNMPSAGNKNINSAYAQYTYVSSAQVNSATFVLSESDTTPAVSMDEYKRLNQNVKNSKTLITPSKKKNRFALQIVGVISTLILAEVAVRHGLFGKWVQKFCGGINNAGTDLADELQIQTERTVAKIEKTK